MKSYILVIVICVGLVKVAESQTVNINGNPVVCKNETTSYSVSVNTSYTNISWSVTGGVINGSSTGNTVSITWGASGGSVMVGVVNNTSFVGNDLETVNAISLPDINAPYYGCSSSTTRISVPASPGFLSVLTPFKWQTRLAGQTQWTDLTTYSTSTLYIDYTVTQAREFRYVTNCVPENASNIVQVIPIPALSPGQIAGGGVTICYNATAPVLTNTAAASGGDGSFVYQWQKSVDNVAWIDITGATSDTYSPGNLTSSTYYRRSVTSGCSLTANTSSTLITVTPALNPGTISGKTTLLSGTKALVTSTLASGGDGAYAYQWESSSDNISWSPVSGATSSTYTLPINSSVFLRRRVISCNESRYSNTLSLEVFLPFVRNTTFLKAGVSESTNVLSLAVTDYSQATQFFDCLGRPLQEVGRQQSPTGNDIVQPVAYDRVGRASIKYLPYSEINENNGEYKSNALKDPASTLADPLALYEEGRQHHFYQTGGLIAVDQKPYAVTLFEQSPLSRVREQGAPGEHFQPNSASTYSVIEPDDRSVKRSFQVNEASEVLKWSYTYVSGGFGLPNAYVGGAPVYYLAGTLTRTRTKDEHNNEVIEYIDIEGHTVLKRVQAVSGNHSTTATDADEKYASTYYIYDDFGNLACVIPPQATRLITQTSSGYFGKLDMEKESFLKRWAFRYTYDARKRMIQKQVPGAEPIYMVYDGRDRLVLTQDGNQRAATTKTWTFTKYDLLNRPIATGIKDTTALLTQTQMQAVVDTHYTKSWARYGESFVGYSASGNLHGYTNKSYPVAHSGASPHAQSFLTVTYYDNYNYRSGWVGTYGANYEYVDENLSKTANGIQYDQPDAPNLNVTGQVTGTTVRVLDGGPSNIFSWLRTASYYDDKYRVVQTVSDNYKGGTDRVTNVYDFVGKVLKSRSTHSDFDVAWKEAVGSAVSGNKLYRTSSITGWNQAGAASLQQLPANTDGWIEVTASETTSAARMVGLAATNPDLGYQNINYTLYFNGTQLTFYENGQPTSYGTFYTGEVYRIERTGTTVKYYKNGALIRTSPTPSSSMLMVDATFYNYGSTLMDVKASFAASVHAITRTFEYDHAGRLLKTYHQIDNGDNVLLSQNEYNELGQLVDKDLHSVNGSQAKQSVDHRYNIRGWLTSINNASVANDNGTTNDDSGDLFGINLAYNDNVLTGGTAQYNGNIASMTWSKNLGLSTIKENGYHYSYDPMNRIKAASFKEKSASWSTPVASSFSESGYDYDLNGNIKSLTRYDHRGSMTVMDNLVYDYGTGAAQSNKLLKVTDSGDDKVGFKEFNAPGDDYTYDANGNMLWDKNKGGQELLTNGNFDTGNSSWTISDTGSRLTFTDGSVNIVSGSATASITQSAILRAGYPYVVVIDMERTSGSALTITAGNVSASASATGISAFTLSPGSGNSFYITIPANFVGKINKVELKGLVVISYNHLNLVVGVTAANDKQLVYTYDATGRKLSQDVLDMKMPAAGGITSEKSSHYSGEFFYENDSLKFINTEEGRVVMTGTTSEYQYHLKDHLGNVRLTFTTKDEVDESLATLETANASQEQNKFLYYNEAVKINYDKFDHTNAGGTYYATRLTGGSTGEKYGLTKTLSVMPGDTVTMEVYAKYLDPNSNNWNTALTNFIGSITGGTAPAGTFVDGGSAGSIGGGTYPIDGINHTSEGGTAPKAYLNYIVFNKDMTTVLDIGFKRITTASREYGQDAAHDKLAFEGSEEVLIKEPGYVYIYLSNENETAVEVFFDDFKVEHKKSPVVQMDDYYAFGLTFNSYQRENNVSNQYLYNRMEVQDELDLGWYDYEARQYDPAIGRFLSQDPLADFSRRWSPYVYGYDNPIRFIDPDGMQAEDPNKARTESKILSNHKNEKTGETTIVERTTTTSTNEDIEVDSEGNKTITKTTTRETVTSTTVMNEKGEVIDNSATSKTEKKSSFVTTDSKGALVERGGTKDFVTVKPEAMVKEGYMGVKTEALVVIAQENYKLETGPWYNRPAIRPGIQALNSHKVTQPANGSQEQADHANGVRYRKDGQYTREDSMRMQGVHYNGPPLTDKSRFKKKK